MKKIIAGFLCLSLIAMDIAFAFPPSGAASSASLPAGKAEPQVTISFPEELGTVEEIHRGTSGKTILYLQDAHDSLEAQENIAKLIHYLVKHDGVKTVYEEGYEGPVPTDRYFGNIQNPQIKEKLSYFLMDKLRLGGAEYAHINRSEDFRLIGIDEQSLYLENIKSYQDAAKVREETEKNIEALRRPLEVLANQFFPKELKAWLKLKQQFERQQIDLLSYLQRIQLLCGDENFAREYPDLALLLEAGSKGHAEAVKKLDPKQIFQSLDRLEDDIAIQFLQDPKARTIFRYLKGLRLLARLTDIEVSEEEYAAMAGTLMDLKTQGIARFIAAETKRPVALSKKWETSVQDAIHFYDLAQKRDQKIQTMLKRYADPEEKISVMVFGGFHKRNIQEILKRLGHTVYTVTPKMSGVSERHTGYYKKIMSVGYHAFEKPLFLATAAKPLDVMDLPDQYKPEVFTALALNPSIDWSAEPVLLARQLEDPRLWQLRSSKTAPSRDNVPRSELRVNAGPTQAPAKEALTVWSLVLRPYKTLKEWERVLKFYAKKAKASGLVPTVANVSKAAGTGLSAATVYYAVHRYQFSYQKLGMTKAIADFRSRKDWMKLLRETVQKVPKGQRKTPQNVANASRGKLTKTQITQAMARHEITYRQAGMVKESSPQAYSALKRMWIARIRKAVSKVPEGKKRNPDNVAAASGGQLTVHQIYHAMSRYEISSADLGMDRGRSEDLSREQWVRQIKTWVTRVSKDAPPTSENVAKAARGKVTPEQLRGVFGRHRLSFEEVGMVRNESREYWLIRLRAAAQKVKKGTAKTPVNVAKASRGQLAQQTIYNVMYNHGIAYSEVGMVSARSELRSEKPEDNIWVNPVRTPDYSNLPVTAADIHRAQTILTHFWTGVGEIRPLDRENGRFRIPLLRYQKLDDLMFQLTGVRNQYYLYYLPEMPEGSFKPHLAADLLDAYFDHPEKLRDLDFVIAESTGNQGKAVVELVNKLKRHPHYAPFAQHLRAVIFVPENASPPKVQAMEASGGVVVSKAIPFERLKDYVFADKAGKEVIEKGTVSFTQYSAASRYVEGLEEFAKSNELKVHYIRHGSRMGIAGYGVIMLQMLEQWYRIYGPDRGLDPEDSPPSADFDRFVKFVGNSPAFQDVIFAPPGGSLGLTSGLILSKLLNPSIRVFAAQAIGVDHGLRSLRIGQLIPKKDFHFDRTALKYSDGIAATIEPLTFEIVSRFGDAVMAVPHTRNNQMAKLVRDLALTYRTRDNVSKPLRMELSPILPLTMAASSRLFFPEGAGFFPGGKHILIPVTGGTEDEALSAEIAAIDPAIALEELSNYFRPAGKQSSVSVEAGTSLLRDEKARSELRSDLRKSLEAVRKRHNELAVKMEAKRDRAKILAAAGLGLLVFVGAILLALGLHYVIPNYKLWQGISAGLLLGGAIANLVLFLRLSAPYSIPQEWENEMDEISTQLIARRHRLFSELGPRLELDGEDPSDWNAVAFHGFDAAVNAIGEFGHEPNLDFKKLKARYQAFKTAGLRWQHQVEAKLEIEEAEESLLLNLLDYFASAEADRELRVSLASRMANRDFRALERGLDRFFQRPGFRSELRKESGISRLAWPFLLAGISFGLVACVIDQTMKPKASGVPAVEGAPFPVKNTFEDLKTSIERQGDQVIEINDAEEWEKIQAEEKAEPDQSGFIRVVETPAGKKYQIYLFVQGLDDTLKLARLAHESVHYRHVKKGFLKDGSTELYNDLQILHNALRESSDPKALRLFGQTLNRIAVYYGLVSLLMDETAYGEGYQAQLQSDRQILASEFFAYVYGRLAIGKEGRERIRKPVVQSRLDDLIKVLDAFLDEIQGTSIETLLQEHFRKINGPSQPPAPSQENAPEKKEDTKSKPKTPQPLRDLPKTQFVLRSELHSASWRNTLMPPPEEGGRAELRADDPEQAVVIGKMVAHIIDSFQRDSDLGKALTVKAFPEEIGIQSPKRFDRLRNPLKKALFAAITVPGFDEVLQIRIAEAYGLLNQLLENGSSRSELRAQDTHPQAAEPVRLTTQDLETKMRPIALETANMIAQRFLGGGVVVYLDGPSAAGKSSFSRALGAALKEVGYLGDSRDYDVVSLDFFLHNSATREALEKRVVNAGVPYFREGEEFYRNDAARQYFEEVLRFIVSEGQRELRIFPIQEAYIRGESEFKPNKDIVLARGKKSAREVVLVDGKFALDMKRHLDTLGIDYPAITIRIVGDPVKIEKRFYERTRSKVNSDETFLRQRMAFYRLGIAPSYEAYAARTRPEVDAFLHMESDDANEWKLEFRSEMHSTQWLNLPAGQAGTLMPQPKEGLPAGRAGGRAELHPVPVELNTAPSRGKEPRSELRETPDFNKREAEITNWEQFERTVNEWTGNQNSLTRVEIIGQPGRSVDSLTFTPLDPTHEFAFNPGGRIRTDLEQTISLEFPFMLELVDNMLFISPGDSEAVSELDEAETQARLERRLTARLNSLIHTVLEQALEPQQIDVFLDGKKLDGIFLKMNGFVQGRLVGVGVRENLREAFIQEILEVLPPLEMTDQVEVRLDADLNIQIRITRSELRPSERVADSMEEIGIPAFVNAKPASPAGGRSALSAKRRSELRREERKADSAEGIGKTTSVNTLRFPLSANRRAELRQTDGEEVRPAAGEDPAEDLIRKALNAGLDLSEFHALVDLFRNYPAALKELPQEGRIAPWNQPRPETFSDDPNEIPAIAQGIDALLHLRDKWKSTDSMTPMLEWTSAMGEDDVVKLKREFLEEDVFTMIEKPDARGYVDEVTFREIISRVKETQYSDPLGLSEISVMAADLVAHFKNPTRLGGIVMGPMGLAVQIPRSRNFRFLGLLSTSLIFDGRQPQATKEMWEEQIRTTLLERLDEERRERLQPIPERLHEIDKTLKANQRNTEGRQNPAPGWDDLTGGEALYQQAVSEVSGERLDQLGALIEARFETLLAMAPPLQTVRFEMERHEQKLNALQAERRKLEGEQKEAARQGVHPLDETEFARDERIKELDKEIRGISAALVPLKDQHKKLKAQYDRQRSGLFRIFTDAFALHEYFSHVDRQGWGEAAEDHLKTTQKIIETILRGEAYLHMMLAHRLMDQKEMIASINQELGHSWLVEHNLRQAGIYLEQLSRYQTAKGVFTLQSDYQALARSYKRLIYLTLDFYRSQPVPENELRKVDSWLTHFLKAMRRGQKQKGHFPYELTRELVRTLWISGAQKAAVFSWLNQIIKTRHLIKMLFPSKALPGVSSADSISGLAAISGDEDESLDKKKKMWGSWLADIPIAYLLSYYRMGSATSDFHDTIAQAVSDHSRAGEEIEHLFAELEKDVSSDDETMQGQKSMLARQATELRKMIHEIEQNLAAKPDLDLKGRIETAFGTVEKIYGQGTLAGLFPDRDPAIGLLLLYWADVFYTEEGKRIHAAIRDILGNDLLFRVSRSRHRVLRSPEDIQRKLDNREEIAGLPAEDRQLLDSLLLRLHFVRDTPSAGVETLRDSSSEQDQTPSRSELRSMDFNSIKYFKPLIKVVGPRHLIFHDAMSDALFRIVGTQLNSGHVRIEPSDFWTFLTILSQNPETSNMANALMRSNQKAKDARLELKKILNNKFFASVEGGILSSPDIAAIDIAFGALMEPFPDAEVPKYEPLGLLLAFLNSVYVPFQNVVPNYLASRHRDLVDATKQPVLMLLPFLFPYDLASREEQNLSKLFQLVYGNVEATLPYEKAMRIPARDMELEGFRHEASRQLFRNRQDEPMTRIAFDYLYDDIQPKVLEAFKRNSQAWLDLYETELKARGQYDLFARKFEMVAQQISSQVELWRGRSELRQDKKMASEKSKDGNEFKQFFKLLNEVQRMVGKQTPVAKVLLKEHPWEALAQYQDVLKDLSKLLADVKRSIRDKTFSVESVNLLDRQLESLTRQRGQGMLLRPETLDANVYAVADRLTRSQAAFDLFLKLEDLRRHLPHLRIDTRGSRSKGGEGTNRAELRQKERTASGAQRIESLNAEPASPAAGRYPLNAGPRSELHSVPVELNTAPSRDAEARSELRSQNTEAQPNPALPEGVPELLKQIQEAKDFQALYALVEELGRIEGINFDGLVSDIEKFSPRHVNALQAAKNTIRLFHATWRKNGSPEGKLPNPAPDPDPALQDLKRSAFLKTFPPSRLDQSDNLVTQLLKEEGNAPVISLNELPAVRAFMERTGIRFNLTASLEHQGLQPDGSHKTTKTKSFKRRQFINFLYEHRALIEGPEKIHKAIIYSSGNAIQGLLFTVEILKSRGVVVDGKLWKLPEDFKVVMVADDYLDPEKKRKIENDYPGQLEGEILTYSKFIASGRQLGVFESGKRDQDILNEILNVNVQLEYLVKYVQAWNREHPEDKAFHVYASNDESMILGGSSLLRNIRRQHEALIARNAMPDLKISPDIVIKPMGGGGPVAGMAIDAYYHEKETGEHTEVWGALPRYRDAPVLANIAIQMGQSRVVEAQEMLGTDLIKFVETPADLIFKAYVDLLRFSDPQANRNLDLEPHVAPALAMVYSIMNDPSQWHLLKPGKDGKPKTITLVMTGANYSPELVEHAEEIYEREHYEEFPFPSSETPTRSELRSTQRLNTLMPLAEEDLLARRGGRAELRSVPVELNLPAGEAGTVPSRGNELRSELRTSQANPAIPEGVPEPQSKKDPAITIAGAMLKLINEQLKHYNFHDTDYDPYQKFEYYREIDAQKASYYLLVYARDTLFRILQVLPYDEGIAAAEATNLELRFAEFSKFNGSFNNLFYLAKNLQSNVGGDGTERIHPQTLSRSDRFSTEAIPVESLLQNPQRKGTLALSVQALGEIPQAMRDELLTAVSGENRIRLVLYSDSQDLVPEAAKWRDQLASLPNVVVVSGGRNEALQAWALPGSVAVDLVAGDDPANPVLGTMRRISSLKHVRLKQTGDILAARLLATIPDEELWWMRQAEDGTMQVLQGFRSELRQFMAEQVIAWSA